MFTILVLFGIRPAVAETLDAPLGNKTGAIFLPAEKLVQLTIQGAAETDKTTWESTDSNRVSLVCGAEPKAAEEEPVDQILFQVGESKWALAAGASVKVTCSGGKPITVVDGGSKPVASYKGPMVVTIESVRSKSER